MKSPCICYNLDFLTNRPSFYVFGHDKVYTKGGLLLSIIILIISFCFSVISQNNYCLKKNVNIVYYKKHPEDVLSVNLSDSFFMVKIENDISPKVTMIKVKSLNENEAKPVISEFLENEASSLAMICNNIDVKEIGIENVIETYNDSKPEYNIISKEDKSLNLLNSLGLVSYIIFVSASMSCGFILEDERLGTKDRVLLSKITELKYYCAQLILYFLLSSVPAIEYFIVCKVLNYNIGFSNEYILLLLLLLLVLLSISFALFISSIIKSKMLFSLIMSAFTVPVFMISGAYWPFEMMNSTLQKIGNALPIRWIYIVIEKLQGGATLLSVAPLIGSLVMLIIVFILLSVFFARNKIVLVNEPK